MVISSNLPIECLLFMNVRRITTIDISEEKLLAKGEEEAAETSEVSIHEQENVAEDEIVEDITEDVDSASDTDESESDCSTVERSDVRLQNGNRNYIFCLKF